MDTVVTVPRRKERRFTLNCFITKSTDAASLVKDFLSVFRGIAYWSKGNLHLKSDKLGSSVMSFSNQNVINGEFNYTSSARQNRHSVCKVSWVDASDMYKPKLEVIELPSVIDQLGYSELSINAFGCTSRGQARRFGKWALFSELLNQDLITFNTSIESMYIAPGDVITVFDADKNCTATRVGTLNKTTSIVTLDNAFTVTANTKYYVKVVAKSAVSVTDVFTTELTPTDDAELATISISGNLLANSIHGDQVFVMFSAVPAIGSEYLVISIEDNSDYTYKVAAMQYDTTKFADIDTLSEVEFENLFVSANPSIVIATPKILRITQSSRLNGSIYNSQPDIDLIINVKVDGDPNDYTYQIDSPAPGMFFDGSISKTFPTAQISIPFSQLNLGTYPITIRAIHNSAPIQSAPRSYLVPVTLPDLTATTPIPVDLISLREIPPTAESAYQELEVQIDLSRESLTSKYGSFLAIYVSADKSYSPAMPTTIYQPHVFPIYSNFGNKIIYRFTDISGILRFGSEFSVIVLSGFGWQRVPQSIATFVGTIQRTIQTYPSNSLYASGQGLVYEELGSFTGAKNNLTVSDNKLQVSTNAIVGTYIKTTGISEDANLLSYRLTNVGTEGFVQIATEASNNSNTISINSSLAIAGTQSYQWMQEIQPEHPTVTTTMTMYRVPTSGVEALEIGTIPPNFNIYNNARTSINSALAGDHSFEGSTCHIYNGSTWDSISVIASGTIAPTLSTTGTLVKNDTYYWDSSSKIVYLKRETKWDKLLASVGSKIVDATHPLVNKSSIVGIPIKCYIGASDAGTYNPGDFYFNTSTLVIARRNSTNTGFESGTTLTAVTTMTTNVIGVKCYDIVTTAEIGYIAWESSTSKLWVRDSIAGSLWSRWGKSGGYVIVKEGATVLVGDKSQLNSMYPRHGSMGVSSTGVTYYSANGWNIPEQTLAISSGTIVPTVSMLGTEMPSLGWLRSGTRYYVNTATKILYGPRTTPHANSYYVNGAINGIPITNFDTSSNYRLGIATYSHGLKLQLTYYGNLAPLVTFPAVINYGIGGMDSTVNLLAPNNSYTATFSSTSAEYDLLATNHNKTIVTTSVLTSDNFTVSCLDTGYKLQRTFNTSSTMAPYLIVDRDIPSGVMYTKGKDTNAAVRGIIVKICSPTEYDAILATTYHPFALDSNNERYVYLISLIDASGYHRAKLMKIGINSNGWTVVYAETKLLKSRADASALRRTSSSALSNSIGYAVSPDTNIFLIKLTDLIFGPASISSDSSYVTCSDLSLFNFIYTKSDLNAYFIFGARSRYVPTVLSNTTFIYKDGTTHKMISTVDAHCLYRHTAFTAATSTNSYQLDSAGTNTINLGINDTTTATDVISFNNNTLYYGSRNPWSWSTQLVNATVKTVDGYKINVVTKNAPVSSIDANSFIIDYDNPACLYTTSGSGSLSLTIPEVTTVDDSSNGSVSLLGEFVIARDLNYIKLYGPKYAQKWIPIYLGSSESVSVEASSYFDSVANKLYTARTVDGTWLDGQIMPTGPQISKLSLSAYKTDTNSSYPYFDGSDCVLTNMTGADATIAPSTTALIHSFSTNTVALSSLSRYYISPSVTMLDMAESQWDTTVVDLQLEYYRNANVIQTRPVEYNEGVIGSTITLGEDFQLVPKGMDAVRLSGSVKYKCLIDYTDNDLIVFTDKPHQWFGCTVWNGGIQSGDGLTMNIGQNSAGSPQISSSATYAEGDIIVWYESKTYNGGTYSSTNIKYCIYENNQLGPIKSVNTQGIGETNIGDYQLRIKLMYEYLGASGISLQVRLYTSYDPYNPDNNYVMQAVLSYNNPVSSVLAKKSWLYGNTYTDSYTSLIPVEQYQSKIGAYTVYFVSDNRDYVYTYPMYDNHYNINAISPKMNKKYKLNTGWKITNIMLSLIKDRLVQRGVLKIPASSVASDYTLTFQAPFDVVPTLEIGNNDAFDVDVTTTGATIRVSAHPDTLYLNWLAWTE
jgi:hypothetical protein